MSRHWNKRGIRTGLVNSRGETKAPKSKAQMGVRIPIITDIIALAAIKRRERLIAKLGSRVEKMVNKERDRVDKLIAKVENTDSFKLINRANALRDKLATESCVEPAFAEEVEKEKKAKKKALPKSLLDTLRKQCADSANTATGMDWPSTRGHFSTKDPAKLDIAHKWKDTFEECFEQKKEAAS